MGDALALCVHERKTHCLRESFLKIKNSNVTCFACRERKKWIVHTWPVLTRHFISLIVKSAHNSGEPYWASSCYVFLTDQHPTAAEINSRSPHLHALTTGERASKNTVREQRVYVRPPCDNMTIAGRSYVVSTYHSLTTYATYDSCNPYLSAWRAGHVLTPCATVSVTYFFSALAKSIHVLVLYNIIVYETLLCLISFITIAYIFGLQMTKKTTAIWFIIIYLRSIARPTVKSAYKELIGTMNICSL